MSSKTVVVENHATKTTTATSSSGALHISPETEVHFRLHEEAPRCSLTLRHVEFSTPHTLAFKVRKTPEWTFYVSIL